MRPIIVNLSILCISLLCTLSYADVDPLNICKLKTNHCIGPGEEYDTNIPNVEVAFQDAADAASAGDNILIRGGTYNHIESSSRSTTFMAINNSGTAKNRITVAPYGDESVTLVGFGFQEGTEEPTRRNNILMSVEGDYVTVKNLELMNAARHCMTISGRYGIFEELEVHDCWEANINVGFRDNIVERNTFRYIETYRSRHGPGIILNRRSTHLKPLRNNIIEKILSYNNGYQPDGEKVPPVKGDSTGGGNSDGIVSSKGCHDRADEAGVENLCPRNTVRNNVVWGNADDGHDHSLGGGSIIEHNISFGNGPMGDKGFKGFSLVEGGISYIGNISLSNIHPRGRGLEVRMYREGYVYHNLAMYNTLQGIIIRPTNPTRSRSKAINNIAALNNKHDFAAVPDMTLATNISSKNENDLKLVNVRIDPLTIVNSVPKTTTIQARVERILELFRTALSPAEDSPLIDAGTLISGFHCPTADDDKSNPQNPLSSCRHWLGEAPDIGPYEFGLKTVADSNPPMPPSVSITFE